MSRPLVAPKPLTGGKVLCMLVAFFGVVFSVNFLMAKLAIDTLPGTEVDSAYSASLAYEKEIAAPMSGLKFQGRFERPTDRRADQAVTLAEIGGGIYRGSAPQVGPGQWDLVLEGDAAGQRMFLSKNRVMLN
jgi:nitrogen fixation protein FixH